MDFQEVYNHMRTSPNIEFDSLDSGFNSLNANSSDFENQYDPSMLKTPLQPQSNEYNTRASASPFRENVYGSSRTSSTRTSPRSSQVNSPRVRRKHKMHEGLDLPFEELRMASMHGNLPLVKALVKQGLSVDQILKSGWTALMYACSSGNPQIVHYLLQEGADPNMHKEMFTALMAACASSHNSETKLLDCVRYLMDYGASIDVAERHRVTALMFASKEGRYSIVQLLVQNKASINKQDNKGWSALSWAAAKGHGKIVRYLLENDADPMAINTFGQRAADLALAAGFSEIAEVLDRFNNINLDEDHCDEKENKLALLNQLPDNETQKATQVDIKTYGELDMVLIGIDLGHLKHLFQKHEVSMEGFLRLNENDLINIGVEAVGARKKILQTIKEIHQQEWKTSSLPNLTLLPYLTICEAASMLTNINKHLRYIRASVGYLRDQIQTYPRILKLGQEQHNVSSLSKICLETQKNSNYLESDLKFFNSHLKKVEHNAEYGNADLIVMKKEDGSEWSRKLLSILVSSTVVGTILWFARPHIIAYFFNVKPRSATVTLDC